MRYRSQILAAAVATIAILTVIGPVWSQPGQVGCDVCIFPLAPNNNWTLSSSSTAKRTIAVKWSTPDAHYLTGLFSRGGWLRQAAAGGSAEDIYLRDSTTGTWQPLFVYSDTVGSVRIVVTPAGVKTTVALTADQLAVRLANGKTAYNVRRYTLLPVAGVSTADATMTVDIAPGIGPLSMTTVAGATFNLTTATVNSVRMF